MTVRLYMNEYGGLRASCENCGWNRPVPATERPYARTIADSHRCPKPACVCGKPSEYIDNQGRMCDDHKRDVA